MPTISKKKQDKISEQLLHYLYSVSPEPKFTSDIAEEIARDEEFTKTILKDLKAKGLLIEVNKNPQGKDYLRRQRWRLSNETYNIYFKHQSKTSI